MNIVKPNTECKNYGSRGNDKIKIITIHCWGGTGGGAERIESIINEWNSPSRTGKPSSNYLIDSFGTIYSGVPETERANTSSSGANDRQAITIEVGQYPDSNASMNDYATTIGFTKETMKTLVEFCAELVKKYDMGELRFKKDKTLGYSDPSQQNLTAHRWFAKDGRTCPGDWFYNMEGSFCDEVNKLLGKNTNYAQYDGGRKDIYSGKSITEFDTSNMTTGGNGESMSGISNTVVGLSIPKPNVPRPIMASRGENTVYHLSSANRHSFLVGVSNKRKKGFETMIEGFSKSAPELGRDFIISDDMLGNEILKGNQEAKIFRK